MTKLAFVDTETTGLDPDRHDPKVYRADVIDVRHPDAQFMITSRNLWDELVAVVRLACEEQADSETTLAMNDALAALKAKVEVITP